jgi:hypothetical protein
MKVQSLSTAERGKAVGTMVLRPAVHAVQMLFNTVDVFQETARASTIVLFELIPFRISPRIELGVRTG